VDSHGSWGALEEFCRECSLDEERWSPDTSFDLVFMLDAGDWQRLAEITPTRPREWRERCAYVLGEGPADGAAVVRELVLDGDHDVAVEAADSLCNLAAEYPEDVTIDEAITPRLLSLASGEPEQPPTALQRWARANRR
jgi:hypothetical protein